MKNNKLTIIQYLTLLLLITFSFGSCAYEDFLENEFEFTSVYLPKEQIDRTFIMDEGMIIGVGAVLGGRLENTENVEITFSLNDDLVTDAGYTVLPDSYYELVDSEGNAVVDNKITISAGKLQGFVYVKADSINYLNDAMSLGNNYALGFQLDNVVKADSILANLKTTVISFSYINQLYGNYFQNGQYVKNDGTTSETIEYSGDVLEGVSITMINPTTVQCDGIANLRGNNDKMNLVIADDNTITIESVTGAIAITDDGGSFYDPATRTITLNYSFESLGVNYTANDVLGFRNRVVDGVNQTGI
ncbi:DUF1735 domain-containing protein [Polaribacter vadi]|uniref:DUF1735 domain-containing protein n=1 Tax=Polaribacter TaxID=52959 RepID=UPI001C088553|nr:MULTISPECIES: DUF1735 domain-containing protein [Polaribacter]MBU3011292.1 DUF1735 domain-containing protein [Polaribacter vadi]MDO6741105.1 DUF1735 domain-containing protein [Polaribacter sp. 1_MG-2023]